MKKHLLSLAAVLTLSGAVSAEAEFRWLWSDHLPRLYDSHNAAWETPVSLPPGAVHWKYDRAEAQSLTRKLYGPGRRVIQPVTATVSTSSREEASQDRASTTNTGEEI